MTNKLTINYDNPALIQSRLKSFSSYLKSVVVRLLRTVKGISVGYPWPSRWKAIKVSENTREIIKSFETRMLKTCSWRRKVIIRAREGKEERSQGHVSHYQELMSRVLPVRC